MRNNIQDKGVADGLPPFLRVCCLGIQHYMCPLNGQKEDWILMMYHFLMGTNAFRPLRFIRLCTAQAIKAWNTFSS